MTSKTGSFGQIYEFLNFSRFLDSHSSLSFFNFENSSGRFYDPDLFLPWVEKFMFLNEINLSHAISYFG